MNHYSNNNKMVKICWDSHICNSVEGQGEERGCQQCQTIKSGGRPILKCSKVTGSEYSRSKHSINNTFHLRQPNVVPLEKTCF